MKKLLLFSCLLTLSLSTFSQNWSLFQPNDTVNFNAHDIHSVVTDSAYMDSLGLHIPFRKVINDSIRHFPSGLTIIQDPEMPNIFGKEMLTRNDSNFFTNSKQNKFLFLTNTQVDSNWTVYSTSTSILNAKVDSIFTDSINGSLDSLKRFVFEYRDTSGNLINHHVNTKKMVISKSNGIIATTNWYYFPKAYLNSIYSTDFDKVFVDLSITKEVMYDYNINDEFHLRETDYDGHHTPLIFPDDYSNFKILSKSVSGDSIIYTRSYNRDIFTTSLASSMGPLLNHYSYQAGTTQVVVNNIKDKAIRGLGYQLVIDTMHGYTYLGQNKLKADNYNSRISQSFQDDIFHYDSLYGWLYTPYYVANKGEEIQGVCTFSGYDDGSYPGRRVFDIKYLIYYKKGNEIWGNPRIVTFLNENIVEVKNELSIYPNPTKGQITLSNLQNIEEIQVFNLQGQLLSYHTPLSLRMPIGMKQSSGSNTNRFSHTITLSGKPGIYLIKAIDQDGNTNTQKVIKQ